MGRHPLRQRRAQPSNRSARLGRREEGFAAAESVLLAMVLIALSLTVATILKPGIEAAARNLNQELAGGAAK